MGGQGRAEGGEGEICIIDTLTSWPKSLPEDQQGLRGQACLGTVAIMFFLFLLFPALGIPKDQDFPITHSLEVTKEMKERDPPC